VEPQQQGRTNQPAEQDAERAFQIPEPRKELDMSTELSTNTTPARGLTLATMAEAMSFAGMVAKSDFAPKDFKGKPESCLLAIQHGSEVGLSPMQSLQSIAVINGRPTIWGDAALALVQSSPACEYIKEYIEGDGDQAVAVCEVKRRGYPAATVSAFSMFDAKRAGLAGKSGPWTQYPMRMLALRARGFALRNAFADALRGLVTAEEAQDYPETPAAVDRAHGPAKVTPVVAQPPALTAKEAATEPLTNSVKVVATAVTAATAADMERSRLAVNKAASVGALEKMQTLTEQRLKTGFYTPSQADELLNLINGKLDILTAEPEDRGQEFPHEAAEHEVTA
jgi:hypothetical protein